MSLDNINVASGDLPVAAGPTVSLEQFSNFGALTQGSKTSDLAALGFPTLALDVDGLINRCRNAGPDAGSCIKSVKRHVTT